MKEILLYVYRSIRTQCERMCTGMFLFVYLSRIRQVITSEQGKKESELHDKRTNAFSFLSDRFFRFYISFSRISYNKSTVENISDSGQTLFLYSTLRNIYCVFTQIFPLASANDYIYRLSKQIIIFGWGMRQENNNAKRRPWRKETTKLKRMEKSGKKSETKSQWCFYLLIDSGTNGYFRFLSDCC